MRNTRFIVTTSVIALIGLAACGKSTTAEERKTHGRNKGDRIAHNIDYIYDARTDSCFAYYGGRGPALATVDCAKVWKFLLNPPPPEPASPIPPPAEVPAPETQTAP